jgi:cytochrome P450
MARAMAELDAAVAAILAARAEQGPRTPVDLVDLLLAGGLSAQEVRDEIVTFLVAGHETVASALTWALVLLAGHPDVAHRVADEAADVLGPDPAARPGADLGALAKLTLARAVVDEAMRLHPPAWLITRRTAADLTLRGRPVPAGSLLILSPWIVHRHPAAWTDPERFDPDRFLDPAGAGAVRGAFLPFGAGPRMCIGRDFAYAEAVLALAMVARAVRLAPSGPAPRALPLVTIRPDGPVLMRVTRR